ncbi:MAG TPA: hypothetical protein DEV93_00825 [Chloroflexi bacterium]|jgi:hypothetical protein|nr:hypothetical protein [Chloroflexota bacterium]
MTISPGAATTPTESVVGSVSELAHDTTRLIQLEITLLKQETVELVKRNALAVGMLAGAALCVLMTLVFVLVLAIQLVPDHAVAAAVIVAVWLISAVALGLLGKARLRIAPPTQAIDSMKENIEWAKQQLKLAPK